MTTTPSPEALALKPCPVPWCSSKPRMVNMHGIKAYVVCNNCGCCGPESNDKTLAATAWNTRPTPTDSGEVIQADREDIHELVRSALQRWGYWQFEMVLGGDGGFEADWRTMEGYHRLAFSRPEPAGAGEPVAWIYRGPHPGEVAIYTSKDRILREAGWTETPLYARPEPIFVGMNRTTYPVGDEALVERVATGGLAIAYGIVEADLEAAKESGDGDWIGLSQEALDALAAIQAIPAPATDAGQSADSLVEALRKIKRDAEARLASDVEVMTAVIEDSFRRIAALASLPKSRGSMSVRTIAKALALLAEAEELLETALSHEPGYGDPSREDVQRAWRKAYDARAVTHHLLRAED